MKRIIIALLIVIMLCISLKCFAEENAQFDQYGGWTGLKGAKTGWFHAEEINGRWWIITPEGNVFWSTGMYCVRFGGLPETGTGKRHYKDACIKKYGGEIEWARVTRLQLKEWGFNTIGDWSSSSIYTQPGFAYVIGIDFPSNVPNVIPKNAYGYFPDVFSQEFKSSTLKAVEERIKSQPDLVNDPWLLGYFLADEPSWYGSKQRRGSLVDDFINLDNERPGKKAWGKFIQDRYGNVQNLNKSWGTNFKDINEVIGVNKVEDNENSKKDKLVFLELIAEEFSKILSNSLREIDKNHMILGTRPSCLYPEVVEGIGKYSDIFSTSSYGFNQGYNVDSKYFNEIEGLYKYAKKPIILGALIPARDTGFSYGIVKTQGDRGISYWRYMANVASNKHIVGLHWFQYFDPPIKCYDDHAANWGLVNENDEPYKDAVTLIAQANKMVYAYALGLTDFAPEFDTFLSAKKTTEIEKGPLKNITLPIANGDFESERRLWGLQTWKGSSKASIDSVIKHDGKYSLKIEGGPDEGWGSVGVGVQGNMNIDLKPGYKYKLSIWIKTQNVEDSAFVRIKTKYKNGEDAYFGTPGAYGTADWKLYEVEFSPREENTVQYLGAQLVGSGTAWFDDIQLEVMAPEGASPEEFTQVTSKSQVGELAGSRVGGLENLSENRKPLTVNRMPISNAGFEEGAKDWGLQAWKGKPKTGVDNRIAHTGKNSVRIQGSGSGWDSAGVAVRKLDANLQKDKKYVLSGWIKTENVGDKAFIRIKAKKQDGNAVYFETSGLNGTGDWEYASKKIQPDSDCAIEYLSCQLVGDGTAWFDDVGLEEVQ